MNKRTFSTYSPQSSGPQFVAAARARNTLTFSTITLIATLAPGVETKNIRVDIVDIKDTGFGIPAGDLPFIFDRFYRVHHESVQDIEGNGLGLAIAKSIIEQHQGKISVDSALGIGTLFTFTLPLMKN
jgi:signal transduction histidine kinase